jgi:hypothetical protein
MFIEFTKFLSYILLISLFPNLVNADEKSTNEAWCKLNNGQVEFRTNDGTYVDCITDKYAVEAEFDYNWKEGIGQALHYAETTGREAAILFIKREKSNKNYLSELERVINEFQLPIKIFIIQEVK